MSPQYFLIGLCVSKQFYKVHICHLRHEPKWYLKIPILLKLRHLQVPESIHLAWKKGGESRAALQKKLQEANFDKDLHSGWELVGFAICCSTVGLSFPQTLFRDQAAVGYIGTNCKETAGRSLPIPQRRKSLWSWWPLRKPSRSRLRWSAGLGGQARRRCVTPSKSKSGNLKELKVEMQVQCKHL